MLDILHPNISNINKNNIDINLSEEKIKINIRGKNKEFFTKVGKILSIILPSESNTSSSNENYAVLWLSPDEWMIYFDENKNSNIFDQLYKDISSLNFGSITDISSQLICINIKGENTFELLSSGSPFNFEKFKNNVGSSTQTIVNHIDVILHHKSKNNVNLFVRRSFSEHLYEWLVDSSNFV